MERTRLAVLGSPIEHSRSPVLHRAAYATLGLDWQYDAVEVTGERLAQYVAECGAQWRGLSLTMPLKRDVLPLLTSKSAMVNETGSANTVYFTDRGISGYNTDVYGITAALARHGVTEAKTVLMLGGGATAASALAAVARLGAKQVFVCVRTPERANDLVERGRAIGLEVFVRRLSEVAMIDERIDLGISTLPGGTDVAIDFDLDTIRDAALLDVAYSPWPSALATRWPGPTVVSGLDMLVMQALAQVRIFLTGDESRALPEEPAVLAAMLAAVAL